jgi:DNA-binding MarR family transcriptional regulator
MPSTSHQPDDPIENAISAFWESLPPVWHTVRSHTVQVAAEKYGITGEQFHILRRIQKGRDSVSQLADARRISRPAISRSVEVLVKKNLISRTQNPQDRRNMCLSLTEEGQELFDEVFGKVGDWMGEKLSALDEDELTTVTQALTILKEAFVPNHHGIEKRQE